MERYLEQRDRQLQNILDIILTSSESTNIYGVICNLPSEDVQPFMYGIIVLDDKGIIDIDTQLPGIGELYDMLMEYGVDETLHTIDRRHV